MFASFVAGADRDWEPSAEQLAQSWADDDECAEFEFPRCETPGALAALIFESTDVRSQSDAELIDSMAGLGRLASWAQAKQSAVIAEFAKRRPPEWGDDARYVPEEIACALSLTVRGASNRLGLAQRLDEALPETRGALGIRSVGLAAGKCHR